MMARVLERVCPRCQQPLRPEDEGHRPVDCELAYLRSLAPHDEDEPPEEDA